MTDAAGKQTQAGQASLGIAHLVKQYANADRPVLNDIFVRRAAWQGVCDRWAFRLRQIDVVAHHRRP